MGADSKKMKKIKVLFPFVEAGFGHIMTEKSICDAFEKKYGAVTEIVRSRHRVSMRSYKSDIIDSPFLYAFHKLRKNVNLPLDFYAKA